MKQLTGGTLFSGFGGVDIGMDAAGIKHIWGIEYDDAIAQVARGNGFNTVTADILESDPHDYQRVDILHMSPPCPNFSNAKSDREESDNDRALAAKCCEFIRYNNAEFVTLENVYGYRISESWHTISKCLKECGYSFNYWHVNSADYGVPQTRKRMIVIARRDSKVCEMPRPTHSKVPMYGLFGNTKKWVGWHEAIEDLVPSLPDSEFAPWQLKRLPEEFITSWMCEASNVTGGSDRLSDEPSQTICAGGGGREKRAFIMNAANPNGNEKRKYRVGDEPSKTVYAQDSTGIRAFIANGMANDNGKSITTCSDSEPIFTITASQEKRPLRGYASDRVVKLTPRALARLQSFPDWYQLPEKKSLACKGIGNAVPPLLYQRIAESLS